ncbi:hypothetical protein H257_11796 [Aphanomyces astaci]|uniref:Gamma-soluble NSF attachment protein n=1 Tax=Aphanomyces astaci TaxID=112090 RepID=W4G0N5_APHAT|nr:hypothetical protein H257_11796 [Aphanomyces astaci]ETV73255.1 hypothetical protein H257_11796 [Aphanomyces astaci]|eukprot:XP_009837130.1 hypothetical protein H257_11796 [Aphanomyces astaci]
MTAKLREAEENLHKAEKHLKTTMFRWSADYMSATPYLEKAAEGFRAGQDFARASSTYVRLAEIQHKNQATFRAAMHMETAAKLHLQYAPKQPGAAKEYYQTAAAYYGETGELGKAAEMLLKGAAALEEVGYTDVEKMYLEACDLMEAQDKPHFAVDVFRKSASFFLKRKAYDDVVANYAKQILLFQAIDQKENMYKAFVSIVVLHLAKPDVVAADQAYMRHLQDDGYLHTDECALSEDLIGAFKRGDEEQLKVVLKKPHWQYLDTPIGRLARTLTMYSTNKSRPAMPQPRNNPVALKPAPAVASPPVTLPVPQTSHQQHEELLEKLHPEMVPAQKPAHEQEEDVSFDLT